MSRRASAWMPFHVADYLRDTMHLSAEEHGAYLLLIMACWTRGGRLPNDEVFLAKTARISLTFWRKKVGPVVLSFFKVEGAEVVHKRVVYEVEKAQRVSETRAEAGRKGGRPAKANGLQTETPAGASLPLPSPLPSEGLEEAPSDPPLSSASADDGMANDAALFALFGDPGPAEAAADPVRDAFEAYNAIAEELGLARAQVLTDERRRSLKARLNGTPDRWYRALDQLRVSRFCQGYNDRGWSADIDFLLSKSKFQKLLEGGYNHLATTETRGGKSTRSRAEQRLDNIRRAITAPSLTAGRQPA